MSHTKQSSNVVNPIVNTPQVITITGLFSIPSHGRLPAGPIPIHLSIPILHISPIPKKSLSPNKPCRSTVPWPSGSSSCPPWRGCRLAPDRRGAGGSPRTPSPARRPAAADPEIVLKGPRVGRGGGINWGGELHHQNHGV